MIRARARFSLRVKRENQTRENDVVKNNKNKKENTGERKFLTKKYPENREIASNMALAIKKPIVPKTAYHAPSQDIYPIGNWVMSFPESV